MITYKGFTIKTASIATLSESELLDSSGNVVATKHIVQVELKVS